MKGLTLDYCRRTTALSSLKDFRWTFLRPAFQATRSAEKKMFQVTRIVSYCFCSEFLNPLHGIRTAVATDEIVV